MAKALCQLKDGEKYEEFVLIKRLNVRPAANGNNFADLIVADRMSEMAAKIWNLEGDILNGIAAFQVVKVRGTAKEYNGKIQLTVQRIRSADDDDGVDINDFVPHAVREPQQMYDELIAAANEIRHEKLRELVIVLIEQKKEPLMYYPAASRLHHSVRGGLLEHISTMVSAARHMLMVYPALNPDLLMAGVLLHDLCKVEEFKVEKTGLVEDYSAAGKLLGHIVMGVAAIGDAGRQIGLDEEITLMIQHMILSHHGEPDYGSPRRPMFMEAEMLHQLDVLDARMDDFNGTQSCMEPGSFSEPINHLDRRRIYRPRFK